MDLDICLGPQEVEFRAQCSLQFADAQFVDTGILRDWNIDGDPMKMNLSGGPGPKTIGRAGISGVCPPHPTTRWISAVVALLSMCAGASTVVGDQGGGAAPAETFTDATTTIRVEVPVEVTLDGEPIRGLTAENFELVDGGDRQEILSIDMVDLTQLQAGPTRENVDVLPVVARRHFLLLFDFSFSKPASIQRAREAAFDLVAKDLHAADLVAVATYSLNQGARVQLAFTPDRDQVRVALASLGQSESTKVRSDPLKLFVGQMDRTIDGDLESGRGFNVDSRAGAEAATFRQLQAMADKAQATQGRREISAMARSIGELGSLMRGVEGRKHVVFFSEGFDGKLLLGTTDEERRNELNLRAQTGSIEDFATLDSSEYFGSAESLNVLERMNQELRRADCTVHAVDIAGLRTDGGGLAGGTKDGLFMMASGTGGSFYENFNDLGEAMGLMLEKTSVTYVLSYQPSDLEHDGKYRKLKVKLKGVPRKAEIVHRPGYFAPGADAENGLATQLDLAQRLWDGREGGSIEARMLATPLRTDNQRLGAKGYVPLLVEIEGSSLLRAAVSAEVPKRSKKKRKRNRVQGQKKTGPARAEIFVYAINSEGSVADFFSQSVALDSSVAGELLSQRGLKLYAPLLLDEGTYVLRLLVRNSKTGQTGLRIGKVVVPSAEDSAPVLLAPFFPEATDAWVLVRGRRQDIEPDSEPAYPFFHGSTVYTPAVRPRLRSGQVLPVFLAGYGIHGAQDLFSEVVDAWGRSRAQPRWRLDDRMQQGDDGLQRYVAAFEVPELPPGLYDLSLSLRNQQDEDSAPGMLSFEVVSADAPNLSRLLTLDSPPDFGPRVRADSSSGGEPGRSAAALGGMDISRSRGQSSGGSEGLSADEIEDRYRTALQRLSSFEGSPDALMRELVAEVAALEVAAVGAHADRRLGRLARSQMRVAESLGAGDPEAMVPLMLLHHDLFLVHKEMRRPYLTHHSQTVLQNLAETYARLGASHGSKVVAARALASLGGHLEAAGRQAGLRLFEQSLALDETNEAALLGLASFYEKRGGPYDEAVRYLQQLIDRRPRSREGRLRLALNQLRVADRGGAVGRQTQIGAAEDHLQFLLDGPETDWIFSLAAQEAARLKARKGEISRAIELLDQALIRMPEEQKLHILRIYLMDRSQQAGTAQRAARHLASSLAGAAPAARGRYNQWPSTALDADRRALREGAIRRITVAGSGSAVGGGE